MNVLQLGHKSSFQRIFILSSLINLMPLYAERGLVVRTSTIRSKSVFLWSWIPLTAVDIYAIVIRGLSLLNLIIVVIEQPRNII